MLSVSAEKSFGRNITYTAMLCRCRQSLSKTLTAVSGSMGTERSSSVNLFNIKLGNKYVPKDRARCTVYGDV